MSSISRIDLLLPWSAEAETPQHLHPCESQSEGSWSRRPPWDGTKNCKGSTLPHWPRTQLQRTKTRSYYEKAKLNSWTSCHCEGTGLTATKIRLAPQKKKSNVLHGVIMGPWDAMGCHGMPWLWVAASTGSTSVAPLGGLVLSYEINE